MAIIYKNNFKYLILTAVLLIICVVGCSSKKVTPDINNSPAQGNQAAMPNPHAMIGGVNMDVGKGGALTPTTSIDAKIEKLEKETGTTQDKDKKVLAALYAERGNERMMDQQASPRIKYRSALKDFRKAIVLDPKNKVASENKALIDSIYRSMGRAIPTD